MDFLDKATASMKAGKADKYFAHGEYKKALQTYLQVLKYKIEKGEPVELGPCYHKIADCFMKIKPALESDRRHNAGKAADYYTRAGKKYEETRDYHNAGVAYESAASCFEITEDPENAQIYETKSAEMFSESGEGMQAGHTYLESAEYAFASRDYQKAADYYTQAAKFELELRDETKASENYFKAGKAIEKLGDIEGAKEFYSRAVGLFDKTKAYSQAALAYESIGRCDEKLSKIDEAIQDYSRAAKMNEDGRNTSSAIANYFNVGRCYEAMGKTDDAIAEYTKAVNAAEKGGDKTSKGNALFNVARCLEGLGEWDKAISDYTASGESYLAVNKRPDAVKSYNRALDISLTQAKQKEAGGDFETASRNYLTASDCYYKINDFERAADLYYQHAQSNEKGGNTEKAYEAYSKAGESYAKSNYFAKAGDSYMRAKKFEEAADYFTRHATESSKEKDFFEAGKYFDLAAWCNKKVEKEIEERDARNSSIWQYVAYLDANKETPDTVRDAEANLRIGQGYLKMDDTRKAIKNLLKARELFEKMGNTLMLDVANLEVAMIDAKSALKTTDYGKAMESLRKTGEIYEKIDLNALDEADRVYLTEVRDAANDYVNEIESKPDVEIVVESEKTILVKSETVIVGEIKNNGTQLVERIIILPNFPSTVEVRKAVKECLKLECGESFKAEVKIYPTETGSFSFKPFEILYHDIEDKKYMKSSNDMNLVISSEVSLEEKQKEMKTEVREEEEASATQVSNKIMRGFIGTEQSSVILITYSSVPHSQVVASVMDILVNERGASGVYISASKPHNQIKKVLAEKGIPIEKVKFVDCITRASGGVTEKSENVVFVENPASLEEISMYSDKLMASIPDEQKFLFIDSVSSLLIYNDERSIEELTHFLVNQIRADGIGGAILSTNESSTENIIKRLIPSCDKEIKV